MKRKREQSDNSDVRPKKSEKTSPVVAKSSKSLKPTVPLKSEKDILWEITKSREGEHEVVLLEQLRKEDRREARRVKRIDERQSSRVCGTYQLSSTFIYIII